MYHKRKPGRAGGDRRVEKTDTEGHHEVNAEVEAQVPSLFRGFRASEKYIHPCTYHWKVGKRLNMERPSWFLLGRAAASSEMTDVDLCMRIIFARIGI